MPRCTDCEDLATARTFAAPEDYRAFVGLLLERVQQGRLQVWREDCPLAAMLGPGWPAGEDTFAHDLRCVQCYRTFQLCVNTWNGRNWWRPSPWQV